MVVASVLQIARFNNINNSLCDTGCLVHIQSRYGSTSDDVSLSSTKRNGDPGSDRGTNGPFSPVDNEGIPRANSALRGLTGSNLPQ